MNPERHQRISEIYAAARKLSRPDAQAYLADVCATDHELRRDVERLLAAGGSGPRFLETDAIGAEVGRIASAMFEASDESIVPDRIGHFRILEKLAQGGMGVVYVAEQDRPRRRVALKVIRPGMASRQMLRRFELEANVLGQLQHPGIAQIHEAGVASLQTADGGSSRQPFFAMELVQGKPIDDFAEAKSLTPAGRLELMARVCDAVQHAHQRGVIHRDLKPSNILVVDHAPPASSAIDALAPSRYQRIADSIGQPKILDFGVARATDADLQTMTLETNAGQLVGTIPYMSPEQVEGNSDALDTRSDVYALGVILFELLAGKLPYDLSGCTIPEAARRIREEEPTSLAALKPAFRGDIATIVAKALEKDKERRYGSAADLAADLRRFLHDEPIIARPASATYQARKFVKRHKAVAAGMTTTFIAMAVGLVVSTSLYLRAENARGIAQTQKDKAEREAANAQRARAAEQVQSEIAQREAAKANAINDYILEGILTSSNPWDSPDRDIRVVDVLDDAAAGAHEAFAEDPAQEAAVYHTLGDTYMGLGLPAKAAEQLERAVEIRRDIHPDDHLDLADSLLQYAVALDKLSRLEEAESHARESLAMLRRLYDAERPEIADGANILGQILESRSQFDEAEALIEEGLDIRRRHYDDDDVMVARSISQLGSLHHARGDYVAAERLLRECLEMCLRIDPEHPRIPGCLNDVAAALKAQEKFADAEDMFRRALALSTRHFGAEHFKTLIVQRSLADTLRRLGKTDEAEAILRDTLEISERVLGEAHEDTLVNMNTLALLLHTQGNLDDAEPMYRRTIRVSTELLGPKHPDTLAATYNLAWLYRWRKRPAEAEPLFRAVVDGYREILGESHPNTIRVLSGLAQCLVVEEKWIEAEAVNREALTLRRQSLPEGHMDIAESAGLLAMTLSKLERDDEAKPLLRECLTLHADAFGPDDWRTRHVESKLGACLGRLDEMEEAEQLLVRSEEALANNPDAPPRNHRLAIERIVQFYDRSEMPEKSAIYQAKLDAIEPAADAP